MKLYLAGPMRGIPNYNKQLFNSEARRLRALGHEVFDPGDNELGDHDLSWYMAIDLPAVCRAEAVAVLPNWWLSEGARLEVRTARALGKDILWAEDLRPVLPQMLTCDRCPEEFIVGQKIKNAALQGLTVGAVLGAGICCLVLAFTGGKFL